MANNNNGANIANKANESGWETYTSRGGRLNEDAPTASIRKAGSISFNKTAIETFHLTDFSHAVLQFNAAEMLIGITLTNSPGKQSAFKLSNHAGAVLINVAGFLARFRIPHDNVNRCPVSQDESGRLIISISEMVGESETPQPQQQMHGRNQHAA